MSSLADIFHRYGPAYRAKYGGAILPSHRQVMADIEQCRTRPLGGHVYYCEGCEKYVYSYHSCQNRHCPRCRHQAGQQWLEKQQQFRLPVPYFMVTFTLPEELRGLARSHQKTIYNLFFRTAAAALQQLAWDERFVGGQIGMVGVLQTLRLCSGQALGPGFELPSPCTFSGAGRRGGGGRADLAFGAPGVSGAGQSVVRIIGVCLTFPGLVQPRGMKYPHYVAAPG